MTQEVIVVKSEVERTPVVLTDDAQLAALIAIHGGNNVLEASSGEPAQSNQN